MDVPLDPYGNVKVGMAVSDGTSVTAVNPPTVPNQGSHVIPVLQLQDGSFVGVVDVSGIPGSPTAISVGCPVCGPIDMVAFDASGNVRWVVPGEQPEIATDDGGLIGESGTTYDQGGNATGQVLSLTQSWIGNTYIYTNGPLRRVSNLPAELAAGFASAQGSTLSKNGTAAQPLPDFVKAISDVVGGDPLGAGAVLRTIIYLPYQATHQIPPSKNVVITERLKYNSDNEQHPQPSSQTGQFLDDYGTRGQGAFGLTQTFYLAPPGIRSYPVRIVPCTSAVDPNTGKNVFGKPVENNNVAATNQAVTLNGDSGSTTTRTCQY